MTVNPTIRDRIIASADALYDAVGRTKLPTVGEVRQHSNASMTDTCAVMREWRRLQTTPAFAPTVEIPERVLKANTDLMQVFWKEAHTNASESLSAAKLAWDKERGEIIKIGDEVSAESDVIRGENGELRAQLVAAEAQAMADKSSSSNAISEERERSASLKDQAQISLARTAEIEKRVDDLKVSLNDSQGRTHSVEIDLERANEELTKLRGQLELNAREIASLRAEMTLRHVTKKASDERLEKVESDLQEARTAAAMAREHAAMLEGKCQALEQQQSVLYAGTPRGRRATSKRAKESEREKVRQERG